MRSILRATALGAVILLIPVVPFLLLGESFEGRVSGWVEQDWSTGARFGAIVAVLGIDIFLPIPSSAVSTYAGGSLGVVLGAVASWIGMTLGAVVGFALARLLGRPFAVRFASKQELQQMEAMTQRHGPLVLVMTRALPILAESCVLLMGATRLEWRRFLPAVLGCNLVLSVLYATIGGLASQVDSLPLALVVSAVIPLLVSVAVRRRLPQKADVPESG